FDMQKAVDEHADYVVFNGKVNALTGDNALTANVGETVRLYVGNAGPNLVSSFHVIGEIMDRVYVEGGNMINEHLQTTLIPAGGATIIEFRVDAPSSLVIVDHSVFRAFNKGALANLSVVGEENKTVFAGEIREGIYLPEGPGIQVMPTTGETPEAEIPAKSLAEKMEFGRNIYMGTCFACHQGEGQGIPNAFPPLANSDYLNADVDRAIDAVLYGLSGEIVVNGNT